MKSPRLLFLSALLCLAAGRLCAAASYQATAESIASHPLPEWFDDAKFGLFIDWGLYSVPGWATPAAKGDPTYPDWYLFRMYQDPAADPRSTKSYHEVTWGRDFARDDFIPLFTAKAYDPAGLMALAKECGAKYVVPFCKHHDGFCLWPSSQTDRNAAKMGPKRDLIGPMVEAARKEGLKFGFYTSLDEWEYPLLDYDGKLVLRTWGTFGHRRPHLVPYDAAALAGKITGKHPVKDYATDYLVPQTREFIDRYDPDLIWFDGDWTETAAYFHTYEVLAYYYNHAQGRKEVLVNDRLGRTRGKEGDFFCSEYGTVDLGDGKGYNIKQIFSRKWEENRGISQSFGYNRDDNEDNVISADALVRMLATIVSRNGNLLLVINLDGDGALPQVQRARLEQLGRWLQVNGEAIYATRPWTVPEDGRRICFTRSKDQRTLYAICFDWPEGDVVLHGVRAAPGGRIEMLGAAGAFAWEQEGENLRLKSPAESLPKKPCDYAYVFRIPLPAP